MRSSLLLVVFTSSCALGGLDVDYGRPCDEDADCDEGSLCLAAPSGDQVCAPAKATVGLGEPAPEGPGIEGCLLPDDVVELAGSDDALTPRVAFNPVTLELGVLFARDPVGGVRELFFQRVGLGGALLGEVVQLTFGDATEGAERFANAPTLAVNPSTGAWAVAWAEHDVATRETTTELMLLRDDGEPDIGPIEIAEHEEFVRAFPEVVASGEGFMLVVREDDPDDLFAHLISGGTVSGRVALGAAAQSNPPLISLDVDGELGLVVAYRAVDGVRLWSSAFDLVVAVDAASQRPRVVSTPGGLDVFYTVSGADPAVVGRRVSRGGDLGFGHPIPGALGDATRVGDRSALLAIEGTQTLRAYAFDGQFSPALPTPSPEPAFNRLAIAAIGDGLAFATEQFSIERGTTRIDLGTVCVP